MALTRKMLKAMGIEEEKIEQIIDAHGETVDALKAERDNYKESAEKLDGVQKELDGLKAKGDGGLQKKFDELTKEYDAYKSKVEAKETRAAKEHAYRDLLKQAGVSEKRLDVVVRATNIDGLEIGEDGKIVDADKHAENIKTEWADFIPDTQQRGAGEENPPGGNGGGKSYEDMTMEEYIAARKRKD